MDIVNTNPNGDLEMGQVNEDREIATISIMYRGEMVDRDVVVTDGKLPDQIDMLLDDMMDTLGKADGSIFDLTDEQLVDYYKETGEGLLEIQRRGIDFDNIPNTKDGE